LDLVRVSDLALVSAFRAELRGIRSGRVAVTADLSKVVRQTLRRHGLTERGGGYGRRTRLSVYGAALLRELEASP
jgi:hypothetical protein